MGNITDTLYSDPPIIWWYFWGIGGLSAFLSTIMILWLVHDHIKLGFAAQDGEVFLNDASKSAVHVLYVIPVFALTASISICFPELGVLCQFVQSTYQAFSLFAFFNHIIALLGGDQLAYLLLKQQEPRKIWAAPPLCLFWGPFFPLMKKKSFTPKTLRICRHGVMQFSILSPLLAFMEFVFVDERNDLVAQNQISTAHKVFDGITILSTMTAMYFLFVVYYACKEPLSDYHMSGKFSFIKLNMILPKILSIVVRRIKFDQTNGIDADCMIQAWNSFVVLMILPLLTTVAIRVFPADEPSQAIKQQSLRLLGMKTSYLESNFVPINNIASIPNAKTLSQDFEKENKTHHILFAHVEDPNRPEESGQIMSLVADLGISRASRFCPVCGSSHLIQICVTPEVAQQVRFTLRNNSLGVDGLLGEQNEERHLQTQFSGDKSSNTQGNMDAESHKKQLFMFCISCSSGPIPLRLSYWPTVPQTDSHLLAPSRMSGNVDDSLTPLLSSIS